MSRDYGYINARVRGMKARLLGAEFYGEALEATDFSAYLSLLSQTPYMRDLEEAQSRYQGLRAVDSALARNFYSTTRSILTFSDGLPGKLVALMLLRYDLHNIKAIARAKHADRTLEDIRPALFPAGELRPAGLESAAAASDMAGVAHALAASKTPLRAAFAKAAARYQSDGDLYALELELDRAYFKLIMAALAKVAAPNAFVRHIRREVDATNLRTALKLRTSGGSSDGLFVEGGKEIARGVFETLINDDSPGALQVLAGTSFAGVTDSSSLSESEAVIRDVMDRSARRLAANPLDIGVVVNYLRAKEEEAARLRLLARGKYYQVPRAALQRELDYA